MRHTPRGRGPAGTTGGGYALAATLEALAGDEPPELVAPHFLTARAASYIGHYRTLRRRWRARE